MNADAQPKKIDDLRQCLFASGRDIPNGYFNDPDPIIVGHAIQHIEDMRAALREFGMSYDTSSCHWYGKTYDWWEENARRVASFTATRFGYDSTREQDIVQDGNMWRLGKSSVEEKGGELAYKVHEPPAIGDPEDVIDLITLLRLVLGRMFCDNLKRGESDG